MSGPIQVIPQGLLGLLQLKQQGRNPSELTDSVQAVYDIQNLYYQRLLISEVSMTGAAISTTFASAAHGQNPFGPIVPNGFTWYVQNFCLAGSLLAAETIRLACFAYPAGAGGGFPCSADYSDIVTARARDFMTPPCQPFWLPPGGQMGARVMDVLTAGTVTVNMTFRAFQVPI